jgi:hypothetical protein
LKRTSISWRVFFLSMSMIVLIGCSSRDYTSSPSPTTKVPVATESPPAAVSEISKPTPAPAPTLSVSPVPTAAVPKPKETITPIKAAVPRIDHIVIVVEENHSYKQIVEGSDSPYMHSLIERGALFTNAHGITHPSQPNYLALFSGSSQGIKDDSCQKPFTASNLASELLQAKLTFTGYSEDLPKAGYTGCSSKGYARKHNPWVQFTNVPEELNRPLTDFPKDFSKLPTVSYVIPNHQDDMHDGTVKQADDWMKTNLDAYVSWADKNRSLLIVTWDEDDFSKANQIPLIIVGPMVETGTYKENVNHYHVLRMIEDIYQLPLLGESKHVEPIASFWH